MKVLAGIYDFVPGGSVAAPVAVAAAFGVAFATSGWPAAVRAAAFFATVLAGFIASTFEPAR